MEELEQVFFDMSLVVDEIIKDYGEPVKPSPEEIELLKQEITANPANNNQHRQKNFILIERVSGEILFSHNVDKYLGLPKDFDLMTFLSTITDGTDSWDYLYDYLSWAKATYTFAVKNRKYINWENTCFRAKAPMRLIDGNIYWVNHEFHPLELDAQNNVISHINTYTVLNRYVEKTQMGIMAELYSDDFYNEHWSKELAETRFTILPFNLHKTQKDILHFFHEHPDATTLQCADCLKVYSVNTIKKYISDSQRHQGIIDKARLSFSGIAINSVKDVVSFLEKIGWFH